MCTNVRGSGKGGNFLEIGTNQVANNFFSDIYDHHAIPHLGFHQSGEFEIFDGKGSASRKCFAKRVFLAISCETV